MLDHEVAHYFRLFMERCTEGAALGNRIAEEQRRLAQAVNAQAEAQLRMAVALERLVDALDWKKESIS